MSQRDKAIRASLTAVTALRDGFVTWDLDHQKALVASSQTREEARAKITAYREGPQHDAYLAFVGAFGALAIAATADDDPSLRAALDAAQKLVKLVEDLKKER